MNNLLIYGGTFDPVHNGHINTAINVQKEFNFDRFIFLPCKIPLLKNNAKASETERIEMLQLALSEYPDYPFEIDPREILRKSPSYMVTTLEDYRQELGNNISITLLMGSDTFSQLPRWYDWEKIVKMSNILVIQRLNIVPDTNELIASLAQYETSRKTAIKVTSHGVIYHYNAGLFNISSTTLRKQIKNIGLTELSMPLCVANYIKKKKLYRN